MLVWVYGTLKKWWGNHRVMKAAEGKYIDDDYIEFKDIDSCGYPMVKFWNWELTNKFLFIEVYEIEWDDALRHLDWLEGYYWEWEHYNLYNRIEVVSLSWKKISVYEINWWISDISDNYFVEKKWSKKFYSWK